MNYHTGAVLFVSIERNIFLLNPDTRTVTTKAIWTVSSRKGSFISGLYKDRKRVNEKLKPWREKAFSKISIKIFKVIRLTILYL